MQAKASSEASRDPRGLEELLEELGLKGRKGKDRGLKRIR